MNTRPKHSILLAILAFAIAALMAPTGASANTTCQFDDPSDTLNVTMTASGDLAELRIDSPPTIGVYKASGAISCTGGAATTTTIDTVNVFDNSGTGDTTVSIVDPDSFGPGKTQEQGNDAYSEIEFNVLQGGGANDRLYLFGSNSGNDFWHAGTMGFDFNAASGDPAPDPDTGLLTGIEIYNLQGNGGNDQISGQGGPGVGSPYTANRLFIDGGTGTDTLEGGNIDAAGLGDILDGRLGDDILRGFGGPDVLSGHDGVNFYDGGAGSDTVDYQLPASNNGVAVDLGNTGQQDTGIGTDTFARMENVIGTKGPDRLTGDDGPNVLRGLDGDDRVTGRGGPDELSGGQGGVGNDGADALAGGAGNDEISGGSGVNTATYEGSPTGVTADLAAGTATGEGTDTLFNVQNLIGSPLADKLTGNAEGNEITGGAGADTISALGGPDKVSIRDGEADTASCGTELDAATADQASLDTVDPDCETTSFLPEPDTDGDGQPGDTQIAFDLSAKAKQRVVKREAVAVTASCPQEDCTVTFSGRVKPLTETVSAGAPERIKLSLKRKQLRKLEAGLENGRKPKVAVTAQATDGAGNAAGDSVKVRAKG